MTGVIVWHIIIIIWLNKFYCSLPNIQFPELLYEIVHMYIVHRALSVTLQTNIGVTIVTY